MTPLVAYLLLFVAVGVAFIFGHLVLGKIIRPRKPGAEKGAIYECGEPTIGSAWIQFDLRFYVVALLFVIFDVEVAFFFPWAEVFGKANNIANIAEAPKGEQVEPYGKQVAELMPDVPENRKARENYTNIAASFERNKQRADQLAWMAFGEIAVFFGVLLVGFAYLWKRGDLAWVRSLRAERETAVPEPQPTPREPAFVTTGEAMAHH